MIETQVVDVLLVISQLLGNAVEVADTGREGLHELNRASVHHVVVHEHHPDDLLVVLGYDLVEALVG